jgi:soluble lytic murein transglycosylase-like protein
MAAKVLSAAQVAQVVNATVPVVRAATGVDVPPVLVLAIIDRESYPRYNAASFRQESNGQASYGLMQILLSTARDLGFTGAPTDLFQPEKGVYYGTLYLARQLKRYHGDTTKAVAAYNAGSARPDGKGGYITTPGYVEFVLDRLKFWLAQAASHPAATAAVALVIVGAAVLLLTRKG